MKIVYWDAIHRQNLPILYPGQLIKVRGFFHEKQVLRQQIDTIDGFPESTFLITFTDPDDLYSIPKNVIPVFHASNDRDVDRFRDVLAEQPIKIVSLFCHDHIHTHNIKADWFLVSGNSYQKVKTVYNNLNYKHECIYLEYYKGSRLASNIPPQFKRRLIPKKVIYEVIKNQFNEIVSNLACETEVA